MRWGVCVCACLCACIMAVLDTFIWMWTPTAGGGRCDGASVCVCVCLHVWQCLDVDVRSVWGVSSPSSLTTLHSTNDAQQAAEATVTQINGNSPSSSSTTTTTNPAPTKRVLLLGAGRVAAPALQLLLAAATPTTQVTVVGASEPELAHLRTRFPASPFQARRLDVAALGDAALQALVADTADVVLSLLPAPLHPRIARACLAAGRHLVTSSYISPELRALDAEAKAKGLVLLNEAGLDPG